MPDALIRAPKSPTLSPKTCTVPPVLPGAVFETSRRPEAITVPASASTFKPDPVSDIVPSSLTVTAVAPAKSPPVSNCAKDRGVKRREFGWLLPLEGSSKLSTIPSWLIRTEFLSGTATTVIRPPGAETVPVLITVPPSRVKFWPSATAKFPALMIEPSGEVVKAKALGFPTKAA